MSAERRQVVPALAQQSRRYGIGEWFGRLLTALTADQRQALAQEAGRKAPAVECPFRASCHAFDPRAVPGKGTNCTKQGGVCSLREYSRIASGGSIRVAPAGSLRTTCPHRFLEGGEIFRWVGEIVLGTSTPLVLREIGFLEGTGGGDVGYVDHVLAHPTRQPLQWCALEIQAVYFSGANMGAEFDVLKHDRSPLPFPVGDRHPDYRSSGPKRLMPQLQIKVPSLRRWGRKMAVVVDHDFFGGLGAMDEVGDISNCDIAWFAVGFEESGGRATLRRGSCRLTTLERAVEGLTGGRPVSLGKFEKTIAERLQKQYPERAASSGLGR